MEVTNCDVQNNMKKVIKSIDLISYGVNAYDMPIREILSEIEEKKSGMIADIFEFKATIDDVDYLVDRYFDADVRRGDRVIITIIKKQRKLK